MTSGLPTERDFAPSGALDEQCAWRHFGGLTLEEAYGKFASAPESYQEDFMSMGGKAFAYYFPVIDRFLRATVEIPLAQRGDRQSWILPLCILSQFDGRNRKYVSKLKPSVLDLCEFMLAHLEHFADDWDEPLQIEDNGRKLQEYICQYETG